MKKLRLAIIGQGRSGRNIHGQFYKSEDNVLVDVVAVVEADERRRERALAEYPGCEVYADYKELFGRDDLDLVVNDTYSNLHYEITKDLLLHKFNVLVEKPFAKNYYECTDLMRIAKEQGVVLAVFQQTFFAPYYLATKEYLKSGKIGDVMQVNIRFNGFARRWDWQTLQSRMGGSVYNTGPHPLGLALDFLDFDENAQVAYSKLDRAFTSGDGEDFAKIVLTAPNKPVVDVEMHSNDAFGDGYTLKILGTKGTYMCTPTEYKAKFIPDGENPERAPIADFLQNDEGYPIYCGEKLITCEEEGEFEGDVFTTGTKCFYEMLHNTITTGAPLIITPYMAARIINVIETVHGQNPLPAMF